MVSSQADDAQWLMKAVLAQLVMKLEGYRRLEAWAGVTVFAVCDLVRDETGTWTVWDDGGS